ncbi:MAG: hypothetical protein J6A01_04630 [Proteobacteria bacterium]|nr:hypothetical protein [Pseudomonadota bacterium]
MYRYLACLVGVCCLFIGCSDSDNDSDKKAPACNEQDFPRTCLPGNILSYCEKGQILNATCPVNQICSNGICGDPCITQNNQCDENNINVISCENNLKKIIPCPYGCQHGACKTEITTQCQDDMQPYCNGSDLISCSLGKPQTTHCELGCEQNQCITLDNPTDLCAGKNYPKCDGDDLITCTGGKIQTVHCDHGCAQNECIIQDDPPALCNENDYPQCDGNSLVTCNSGKLVTKLCPKGCENNSCKGSSQPVESVCGNDILEEGEACDGKQLGKATCADFVEKKMDQAIYTGEPVCNDTCTAVEAGTCAVTFCGNNKLDILTHDPNNQVKELCDEVNGKAVFSETKTCSDIPGFEGLEWESGGKPGCNKTCDGLSHGTCVLKSQPLFGIKKCAFTSLEKDETTKTVTGKLRVVPVSSDATLELISGILACGHRENPTYTWGKNNARYTECADCASGEYELIADFSYEGKTPGKYDCVFQTDIDDSALEGGSNSTEYVNCPVVMGAPHSQKETPTDVIIRTYEFTGEALDGTVLAYWDFSGYTKNDEVTSIPASDGKYASKSTIQLSDNSKMKMVTNGGDMSNLSPSASGWSTEATLSFETAKHFSLKTSTSGYKNIRIQYNVAGSGEGTTKHVATAVNVLKVILSVGEVLTFDDDRVFHAFPLTTVADGNANDQPNVEFRIYPYGATDKYGNEATTTTMRVDDIYIIGDPK